ncbi:CCN family member 3-like isoform X2 [Gordionus sp. m RMFG-2023]|uniref:CCN family member 3-like isoform X2 n=1 Tax=Gordionus sp. m RMFG-2023 TaxID=3053472 RepID=UPI0031FD0321
MQFAVKLCFGLVLVLFNSNRFIVALDCPCQELPVKCTTPPPTNCKGEVITDACDCCHVCAKTVGEVCGGSDFEMGKCENGFICFYDFYSNQTDGKCVLGFPRNLQEPCGDALQQGYCKPGLICSQIMPGVMNMCVIPPKKLPIQQRHQSFRGFIL